MSRPRVGATDALKIAHKSVPLGVHRRPEALDGSQGFGIGANHVSLPLEPRRTIALEGDDLRYGGA